MITKKGRSIVAIILSILLTGAPGAFSAKGPSTDLNAVIERVEKAITHAADLYETGKIKPGKPYVKEIASGVSLSFSQETFEKDLARAFDVYHGLLSNNNKIQTAKNKTAEGQLSGSKKSEEDRIGAMMRAEKKTASLAPKTKPQISVEYDIYTDYRKTHLERMQQEDQSAEADRKSILAERRAAETELVQKRNRKAALQNQSMKWQSQLDKQASASARKAAEWQKKHSFGAFARTFLATVVQTAVGSFTGGLLTPIATELSNQAVKNWFGIDPDDLDDDDD
jgi:hypothetical protein